MVFFPLKKRIRWMISILITFVLFSFSLAKLLLLKNEDDYISIEKKEFNEYLRVGLESGTEVDTQVKKDFHRMDISLRRIILDKMTVDQKRYITQSIFAWPLERLVLQFPELMYTACNRPTIIIDANWDFNAFTQGYLLCCKTGKRVKNVDIRIKTNISNLDPVIVYISVLKKYSYVF